MRQTSDSGKVTCLVSVIGSVAPTVRSVISFHVVGQELKIEIVKQCQALVQSQTLVKTQAQMHLQACVKTQAQVHLKGPEEVTGSGALTGLYEDTGSGALTGSDKKKKQAQVHLQAWV